MAFLSRVYHSGDGGTAGFNVPFGYLSQSHVEVYVDDTLKTEGAGNHYTWTGAATITFTAGNEPPAGTNNILFKRVTPKSTRNVDYQDASSLTESEMDEDSNQLFYIAQEAFDDVTASMTLNALSQWDAQSNRIINVATPTASTDAATKAYADSISAAAGNVPTPGDPGEDDYILKAGSGTFAWTSPANIRTALGLGALALKATIDSATLLDADVVTTAKIINDAVTLAKIASGTAGDILYWDGSGNPAALAKGADGQFLKLASGIPSWASPDVVGWEHVPAEDVDFGSAAAATADFTMDLTSYDEYMIVFEDLRMAAGSAMGPAFQVNDAGTPKTDTNYGAAYLEALSTTSQGVQSGNTKTTHWNLSHGYYQDPENHGVTGAIKFWQSPAGNVMCSYYSHYVENDTAHASGVQCLMRIGWGAYQGTFSTGFDGIRLKDGGYATNFDFGTAKLYRRATRQVEFI